MHAQGLRPHPNAGADSEDPLLFRHRYQHHDEITDKLMYYQYEAKRHAHVVVLQDLGVLGCEAAPTHQPNATTISLNISVDSVVNLTAGAVIVGDGLGCVFRAMDGTSTPWHNVLRERVVAPVHAAKLTGGGNAVTMVTEPAALNDVFEHAQLEYFHGRPDNLHFTRSKRLESLASHGHATSSSTYSFASTEDVIADAKVAAARRRLAPGVVDGVKPKQSQKPPLVPARPRSNSSRGRELDHWSCAYGNLPTTDMNLCISGENCNSNTWDFVTSGTNDGCYFKTYTSRGSMFALKPGNTYTLRWTSPNDDPVEIFVQESDGGWGSTHCYDMTQHWIPSQQYSGSACDSPNSYTFTMPDLSNHPCANDFLGGAPEFQFKIQTKDHGCHRGYWGEFVQLYNLDPTGGFELAPSSSSLTFGDSSAGLSLKCTNCHVSGSADAHVLVRVDQYNPFAESWTWADVTLEAAIDFEAQAWAYGTRSWQEATSLVCAVCASVSFASTSVNLGILAKLETFGESYFSAEGRVTYRRHAKAAGQINLHTVGSNVYKRLTDFARLTPASDPDANPLSYEVDIQATATVGLYASLYAGLFASVSTMAEAEVYAKVRAGLIASADFTYQTASDSTALAPYTCTYGALACSDMCSSQHDLRITASISGRWAARDSPFPSLPHHARD